MTTDTAVDISNYVRLPVIKSIDQSTLPELSPRQTIFVPMCGRTNEQVCCDQVELVNQGEPTRIDKQTHSYVQPVLARLKSGGVGCTNCLMTKFYPTS